MQVSENFTLEEFTRSQTAARRGIKNQPNALILKRIMNVTAPGLEVVRGIIKKPMTLTSGYRSEELNDVIPGSSDTSAHTLGFAADFVSPKFGTPLAVCRAIVAAQKRGEIQFDQLIYEYGEWVHISFDPRMRGQVLTKMHGQPYKTGLPK